VRSLRSLKNVVLILGDKDAGKTALVCQLRYGFAAETCASVEPHQASYRQLVLVDIPGHPKLRHHAVAFAHRTRAVIFAVDAVTADLREACEYLYDVLKSSLFQQQKVKKLLLLFTKYDLPGAGSISRLRKAVEAELDQIRKTRGTAVDTHDADANEEQPFLGYEGEAFNLDHLDVHVDIAACSVRESKRMEANMDQVKQWLTSLSGQ